MSEDVNIIQDEDADNTSGRSGRQRERERSGMGAAHIITKRLFDKIDYDATYVNAITSRGVELVRIPFIVDSDREAVQMALRTCIGNDSDHPRVIRVANSFHTEYIRISEAMYEEAKENPQIEIIGEPEEWGFDKHGNLW